MAGLTLDRISFVLAEDNEHMRRLIKLVLRSFRATDIREAEDGSEALKLIQSKPPDILITDMVMEPLNGLELTTLIRTSPDSPNPFLPIIMMSAYTTLHNIMTARDCGVNEFVAKPLSARALYSRVSAVVLNPRRFVRVGDYFGPDRRRRDGQKFSGPDRRGAGDTGPDTTTDRARLMDQDGINEVFHPDGLDVDGQGAGESDSS